MTVVLDAGAFVAAERGDREIAVTVKRELLAGRPPLTHGGIVAQVWRGGAGRQGQLARLLAGCVVDGVDEDLGKTAGLLLGSSRANDAVDAALVALCRDGDEIYTSDVKDIRVLAEAANLHVELIPV